MRAGVNTEVLGRKVLVIGLGRFGGGVGVSRWLCEQGARVAVTDLAGADALADSVAALNGFDIALHLGGHDERDLDTADLVVVNPAVDRRKSPFFARIVERSLPWTTEINLFLERCRGRVLGVTGTVGKSTTCALLYEALRPAFPRAWFGGNVGRSLLEELPRIEPDDPVVLELSSFQLETAAAVEPNPHVALVTNIRPNHLDRHGSYADYVSAKLNLFRFQRPGTVAMVGPGDEALRRAVGDIAATTGARLVALDEPRAALPLRIPGRHNQVNAACALAVAGELGVESSSAAQRVAAFEGLPHRLQHVGRIDGVDYYNDSKTTTPQGVETALAAFDRPVVVIVGGQNRGDDLQPLIKAVARKAKAVVCMGESGPRIAAELAASATRSAPQDTARGAVAHETRGSAAHRARAHAAWPHVEVAYDLPTAVAHAARQASPGDVILLSPGAPSYGQFVNYEHRGGEFIRLVTDYLSWQ